MTQLNAAAASAMLNYDVHAATDVTGFGLVGHALKMAEGSGVTFVFEESDLPLLPGVLEQCRAGMIPGGGERNREFYAPSVRISDEVSDEIATIAFDPQTSGGLLIALPDDQALALLAELQNCGHREAAHRRPRHAQARASNRIGLDLVRSAQRLSSGITSLANCSSCALRSDGCVIASIPMSRAPALMYSLTFAAMSAGRPSAP